MRIFAISDLHLSTLVHKPMDIFGNIWDNYWEKIQLDWRNKVNDDDIVLISGDISWAMNMSEATADLDAIGELPGRKIIIRGNHDYWWSSYKKVTEALPLGMYAIQNNALLIDGYIFCGTRLWTCMGKTEHDIKVYEHEKSRLKMTLDAAKKLGNYPVILMLHYPPFNLHFEDNDVTAMIAEYNVACVVYGHLHVNYCRSKAIVDKDNIKYYLTSCDQVNNQLVEIPTN